MPPTIPASAPIEEGRAPFDGGTAAGSCDPVRSLPPHMAFDDGDSPADVVDGLLGQGRNVLVGITTNEDLERLHPAVVRPGRCLARIEVGRLSRDEAVRWLGTGEGIGRDGATLAELYALRRGPAPTLPAPTPLADGLYL